MRRFVQLITLHCALVVAEVGSFLGASRCLGIHHSVLSRRIRELEHTLSIILFERHPHGVRPTPAGAGFLRNLRRVLNDLDGTLAMVKTAGRGKVGNLSIGFDVSLQSRELLEAVADFVREEPDIAIHFVETRHAELAAYLNDRAIDLVISPDRLWHFSNVSLPLWESQIVVAVAADHPLAESAVIEWAELESHTILTNIHSAGAMPVARLAVTGQALSIVHHDVSQGSLLGLVREGLGVALLFESATAPTRDGIALSELSDGGKATRIQFFAHWRPNNKNPVLAAFIEFLRQRHSAA
ncbi:LysR family transcriptional regulator [Mesorhizobium sp. WSM4303]|uniref:LysR family transcriptional regulator n=1 Tax=unclassified Mesorhizobium TaxID=325217 RepID=UPI00115CC544|nr:MULTISPECIES: LysR family transcriptional regulator [unclassified Mesorhizobium]TRC98428.1 LysR family transcriptional regulator [Mesorhizobium sp. WSM4306]TRC99058.1 LysR family transcriptional regulator [Mesorhizobium sp. WSM4303]